MAKRLEKGRQENGKIIAIEKDSKKAVLNLFRTAAFYFFPNSFAGLCPINSSVFSAIMLANALEIILPRVTVWLAEKTTRFLLHILVHGNVALISVENFALDYIANLGV